MISFQFEESRQEIDFLRRENSSLLNQLENLSSNISYATQRENEMRRKISALEYHQVNVLRSTNGTQRHEVWQPTSRTDQFCEEDECNYGGGNDEVDNSFVRNEDEEAAASSLGSFAPLSDHQSPNRGHCGGSTLRNGLRYAGSHKLNIIGGHAFPEGQGATSQLPATNASQEHPYWNNTCNKTTNIAEEKMVQEGRMPLDGSRGLRGQNAGYRGQHVRWQREDEEEEGRRPPLGWIPVPRRGASHVTNGDGGQKVGGERRCLGR